MEPEEVDIKSGRRMVQAVAEAYNLDPDCVIGASLESHGGGILSVTVELTPTKTLSALLGRRLLGTQAHKEGDG